MASLKSSTLVAYPVPVGLLNFSKKVRRRLVQSGYSSGAFLLVETKKSEGIRMEDIRGPRNQYMVISRPRYRMLRNGYRRCAIERG